MRSFISGARILALWSVASAAPDAFSAQLYAVKDLGIYTDLAGRADSRPNAINSFGRIAGANVTNGAYRGWLYGGAWTNLGTLGGNESLASGINDSNRVVGYSRNASGTKRGFLWTPGGTDGVAGNPQMKELGTFGGLESEAGDINNSGQIAGYAQTSSRDHAFLYSGGTMIDIGASLPSGMGNSYAYSLNEAGRIAGTGYNNGWTSWHAFYYDGVNTIDLGTFGGQNSSALSINNSNVIVGYYTLSGGFDHAFRYALGSMTDLGTLGGDYSYANGINNSNVVVGGSYTNPSNTVFHAFIWATNVMKDLNTLLDATGAGWTLMEARAINDAGWIVGTGTRSGATRGFLLTPLTAPQITQQPTNVTVTCQGQATFAISATPEGLSYQWYKGAPPAGLAVANARTNLLILTNINASSASGYYAIVTNAYGSATSSVAALTVVDTTMPSIAGCPSNITSNAAPGVCTAVVTWASPTGNDNCDGVIPVLCAPASGSTFAKGVTSVTCRASDSSLNTNTCSFTVTVVDRHGPSITGCPINQTNYTAPGSNSAVVTWTSPTATDNCGGTLLVTCAPTNGSTFGQGVTTVTCWANDVSLNTNTCTFTVTVAQLPAPRITNARFSGADLLVTFTTTNLGRYALEGSKPLLSGTWSNIVSGIPGTGGLKTATNYGAVNQPYQFYRIRLSVP